MKKVEITLDLANIILQYLSSKPYSEVAALVKELEKQASESLKEKEEKKES